MRQEFSRLTIVVLAVAMLASWRSVTEAAAPAPAAKRPAAVTDSSTTASTDVSTDDLLSAAIEALDRYDSVSVRIRQQVNLFGQRLFGPGRYVQQGRGAQRRFRLDLSLQLAAGNSTNSRINDGRTLWILQDTGGTLSLRSVDLRRIRAALEASRGTPPAAGFSSPAAAIGSLDGLPGVLRGLWTNFVFEPPVRGQAAGRTVWILRGRWRAERILTLQAPQKKAILRGDYDDEDNFVGQLPAGVVLHLGTANLFPYHIAFHRREYLRTNKAHTIVAAMELFDVRLNAPVDASLFARPSDVSARDDTDAVLQRLGVAPSVNEE